MGNVSYGTLCAEMIHDTLTIFFNSFITVYANILFILCYTLEHLELDSSHMRNVLGHASTVSPELLPMPSLPI